MYSVTISDSFFIAHSLNDPFFGKAQNTHGATIKIEVSFYSSTLNNYNVVLDIDQAHSILNNVIEPLDYQNLDEMEEFQNEYTTLEFLARYCFKLVKNQLHSPTSKEMSASIDKIAVILHESPTAKVTYEEPL